MHLHWHVLAPKNLRLLSATCIYIYINTCHKTLKLPYPRTLVDKAQTSKATAAWMSPNMVLWFGPLIIWSMWPPSYCEHFSNITWFMPSNLIVLILHIIHTCKALFNKQDQSRGLWWILIRLLFEMSLLHYGDLVYDIHWHITFLGLSGETSYIHVGKAGMHCQPKRGQN